MEQQRLIGVITFIDYDKGFGFLSTNGYGIDIIDLNDKIQLYFKISSLENPEYIFEGDWVTFNLQKNNDSKHKRDSAINIRLINFNKADYQLSLQYRGIYANIFVRLASSMQDESFNSNVTLSITNLFIEHSKYQIVVNTLADFYQGSDDDTRADIINALSNSAEIQKILIESEWSYGLMEDINRNTILIDLTLYYHRSPDRRCQEKVLLKKAAFSPAHCGAGTAGRLRSRAEKIHRRFLVFSDFSRGLRAARRLSRRAGARARSVRRRGQGRRRVREHEERRRVQKHSRTAEAGNRFLGKRAGSLARLRADAVFRFREKRGTPASARRSRRLARLSEKRAQPPGEPFR